MYTSTYMHKCLHIHMKGEGNTPIKCRGLQMTGFPESEALGPHWIPKWIYLTRFFTFADGTWGCIPASK